MAGAKGRSGGRRPGAGRPRIHPLPPLPRVIAEIPTVLQQTLEAMQAALRQQQARLIDLQRAGPDPMLLRRLTDIERHLALRELPTPSRHTRPPAARRRMRPYLCANRWIAPTTLVRAVFGSTFIL